MKSVDNIFFLLIFFLFSCKNNDKVELNENCESDYQVVKLDNIRPNLNVSILLDLSDRINPTKYPNSTMEFFERDLGYIKSIAQGFEIHLRNKRSIAIDDYLQIFIEPEPFDSNLNDRIKQLKRHFTKDNSKKCEILGLSKAYDSISQLIYKSAIDDNKYVGSDIWRFFKNKVHDYCIRENYRNILIILTDGYVYHRNTLIKEGNRGTYITPQTIRASGLNSSNWLDDFEKGQYGFIKATNELQNLEVLVLGVNPDEKNPFEDDIIKMYWSAWLKDMGVKKHEIKNSDLPINISSIVSEFIWNEEKAF